MSYPIYFYVAAMAPMPKDQSYPAFENESKARFVAMDKVLGRRAIDRSFSFGARTGLEAIWRFRDESEAVSAKQLLRHAGAKNIRMYVGDADAGPTISKKKRRAR